MHVPLDDHQHICQETNPLIEDNIFTSPKGSDASHEASIRNSENSKDVLNMKKRWKKMQKMQKMRKIREIGSEKWWKDYKVTNLHICIKIFKKDKIKLWQKDKKED